MRALVFNGPRDMSVEERPDPEPKVDEALLAIIATGICGSDIHGYTGENGRRYPGQVMGHETVASVLVDRSGRLEPGALVTVNPVIGCGHCPACAVSATQRCPDRSVIGVRPDLSSAFAEQMVAPSENLVPLPGDVPPELGSLVEPLAVGYHAARRGSVTDDDRVLVVGGGPIGQAAALAARRLGAATVVVAELNAERRAMLSALGFEVVDPAAQGADAAVGPLGGRASVVLDAVGTSRTMETAFASSAFGSRIVLVGMGAPVLELSAYAVSTEERTILGSFCYDTVEFRDTAAWSVEHAREVGRLIDARIDLDEAPEAFRRLSSGELRASKVLVFPNARPEDIAAGLA